MYLILSRISSRRNVHGDLLKKSQVLHLIRANFFIYSSISLFISLFHLVWYNNISSLSTTCSKTCSTTKKRLKPDLFGDAFDGLLEQVPFCADVQHLPSERLQLIVLFVAAHDQIWKLMQFTYFLKSNINFFGENQFYLFGIQYQSQIIFFLIQYRSKKFSNPILLWWLMAFSIPQKGKQWACLQPFSCLLVASYFLSSVSCSPIAFLQSFSAAFARDRCSERDSPSVSFSVLSVRMRVSSSLSFSDSEVASKIVANNSF